ncbi:MAG: serine hydrolase [Verrucomicrobiota bacterium]
MKTVRVQAAILSAVFLGICALPALATPFVALQNLSSATLQAEFDAWTAAPYNYRMTRLSGCDVAGQARYAVIFEKSTKTTPWSDQAGMTASAFTTYHNQAHANGYRLVWLEGFGVGTTAYYNGIWEKTNGATQRVRLGEALLAHQNADDANQSDGFSRVDVSSFSVDGSPLHAGVWATGLVNLTEVRYSQTPANYQTEFNTLGGAGWYLYRVSGYTTSGLERFTGVWRRTSLGEGWSHHGIRSEDFSAFQNNAQYVGYRPVFVDAYNVGTDVFYNATWVRNGGLSTTRLNSIATEVQDYMTDHALPGLSLAIAYQGRLVYSRGFGYAETADWEVADPLHRWRFASVSKPVCAVAALRALEDSSAWSLGSTAFGSGGLFANDYGDPTGTPYTTNEKAITLRQLMNMTAGWADEGKLWYNAEPGWGTNHTLIIDWHLDNRNTMWTPGTHYRYNNFNYQVAARIPEKITGMSFYDYAKQEIFDPCGMTSMSLGARTFAGRLSREVVYYPGDIYGNPEDVWPARMDGSTAWIGRPADLLLMGRRIDGNPRQTDIIGSYALSQMQLGNGQLDDNGNVSQYGLGWYAGTRNGHTWWQHNGAMGGTQAILVVRDDGEQSFAYAANSVRDSDRGSGTFRNLILDQMDAIDDAKAWPQTDHFRVWNPAYDAWVDGEFSATVTGRLGFAEVIAPNADPDEDGRCNALEAYLGSDPVVPDKTSWYTVSLSSTELTWRWNKKNGDRGVVATPRRSSNLNTWADNPTGIVDRADLINQLGYTYQEVKLARSSLPARFVRLEFETP